MNKDKKKLSILGIIGLVVLLFLLSITNKSISNGNEIQKTYDVVEQENEKQFV
jgi:hypothetical protein